MTQYNRVNVKLSNLQLNKLKSAIRNENDVAIRLSPNMIGNSNDKNNFPHEILLTRFLVFVKHFQIIHQLILNFQKLNYQKLYSQKDF